MTSLVDSLAELRSFLLQYNSNVKFLETVNDLNNESLPLITLEIGNSTPNVALNTTTMSIIIFIYDSALVNIIKLYELIKETLKYQKWMHIRLLQETRALDTGTVLKKTTKLIYGAFVIEVVV